MVTIRLKMKLIFQLFPEKTHKIEKVHHPKKISGHDIYYANLATSTLIVLFSEMLKFSPQENSNNKNFVKENVESSRIFYFSK